VALDRVPIIKYDDRIIERFGDFAQHVNQNFVRKLVTYAVNGDYRRAVDLKPWLEAQVAHPALSVVDFLNNYLCDVKGWSDDNKALAVQRAVQQHISYVTDSQRWSTPEYWATADETLSKTMVVNGVTFGPREGDCEDGAILIYVLCRLLDIPSDHLFLWCGDVVGGGHCCCVYRPRNYPLNFRFLDWCYWPLPDPMDNCTLYSIIGNDVIGERVISGTQTGFLDRNYIKMWFLVNENESFLSLDFRYKV